MSLDELSVQERAERFDVRPFGPLDAEHPLANGGRECPICFRSITAGDVTCLLVLDSPDNRQAAEESESGFYNAEATPAHWTCVTGSDDPQGDFERWYRDDPEVEERS